MTIRLLLTLFTAGLLAALTGCIEQASTVLVRPDGSGTIQLRLCFSPKLQELVGGQATPPGFTGAGAPTTKAEPAGPNPLAYNEDTWKAKAADFGTGVTFMQGKSFARDNGWRGYTVDYSFTNIATVHLKVEEGQPTAELAGDDNQPGALPNKVTGFSFQFTPATATAAATLVVVPQVKPPPAPGTAAPHAAANAPPPDPKEREQMQAMMKSAMAGMRITTTIAVAGKITETTAHRVATDAPAAVTMLDLNLDQVMADPAAFTKLVDAQDGAAVEMTGLPGFRVEEQPVTIKFQ